MIEIISFGAIIFTALLAVALFVWTIACFIDSLDSDFKKTRMADWNSFKWIANGLEKLWNSFIAAATWKPKTGIDKEIAEGEKEIAELEKYKKKMDKLTELKQRKDELFSEVNGTKEHSGPTKVEEKFYFGRDEEWH